MVQSSDMFKKIKSLFIVEDANSGSIQENQVGTESVNAVQSNATAVVDVSENPLSVDAKPDQKFIDLLLRAIESNNMEGFDYLEYKNSLKSIANVIPDESMRYKSTFEMAKTMGLSKEKLIQSADQYILILKNEDKKFKEALENQKAKQVQGRGDQLVSVEKSITEKEQQITKLTQEIDTARKQLDAMRSEINDAVVKIDVTNQQFVSSYNLVYGQIMEDIEKIKINL